MPPTSFRKSAVQALAVRCVNALASAYVPISPDLGGWSKYFETTREDVGVWGTASGIIGLAVGEEMGVVSEGSDLPPHLMREAGARFLVRQQLTEGEDAGAWSITQLASPAFVDTTAIAISALSTCGGAQWTDQIAEGIKWLCRHQLPDSGGWSNLERRSSDAEIPKTCPTAYATRALAAAIDHVPASVRAPAEAAFRRGVRALRDGIVTNELRSGNVGTGWGRLLNDRLADPAYTALAVTTLCDVGEAQFLTSHRIGLIELFRTTSRSTAGIRFDQGPWPTVRDIWTPRLPLTERFMTFFTTAWVARSLGCLQWEEGTPLVRIALQWLASSDRGGRYYDYETVAHNFATADALWACRAYLGSGLTVAGQPESQSPTVAMSRRQTAPRSSPQLARTPERDELREILERLSDERDPYRRGRQLERALNSLFLAEGLSVRESFTLASKRTGRAVEQIDGAIEVDGHLYLVEAKWWSRKLAKADIANHLVAVMSRADCRGIVISSSGFHESAIAAAKNALPSQTIVLVELQEIISALTDGWRIIDLLRPKVEAAVLEREPLSYPLDR